MLCISDITLYMPICCFQDLVLSTPHYTILCQYIYLSLHVLICDIPHYIIYNTLNSYGMICGEGREGSKSENLYSYTQMLHTTRILHTHTNTAIQVNCTLLIDIQHKPQFVQSQNIVVKLFVL